MNDQVASPVKHPELVYYVSELFAPEFVPRREALQARLEEKAVDVGAAPLSLAKSLKAYMRTSAHRGEPLTAEEGFAALFERGA